tara:strand:+ start:712 stop:1167 length:456 start_codon:yes stop_codon:yes gene_type:complete
MVDNYQKNGVFLGIDFGLKRIGISLGQSITNQARPLIIIQNDKSSSQKIDDIINEWMPLCVIIGYPVSDKKNLFMNELNQFIDNLSIKYQDKINILKFSEVLSTEEAKTRLKKMRSSGVQKKRKKYIDDVSASLILENWLNENIKDRNGNR